MTGWLVAGIVALGVLVLVLALMALGRRARPLQRATRRARLRAEQAEQVQVKLVTLQDTVASLQALLPGPAPQASPNTAAVVPERLESRQA